MLFTSELTEKNPPMQVWIYVILKGYCIEKLISQIFSNNDETQRQTKTPTKTPETKKNLRMQYDMY